MKWIYIIAVLLVLGGSGYWFLGRKVNSSVPVPEVQLQKFSVGMSYWPGYYLVGFAAHLGYFKDEGLDVSVTLERDSKKLNADFAAGKYDAIGSGAGTFVMGDERRKNGKMVLLTDYAKSGDAIVVSNPAYRSVKDLKGKRVASLPSAGYYLYLYLRKYGMGMKDITYSELGADALERGLNDKTIDAGYVYEPYLTQMMEKHKYSAVDVEGAAYGGGYSGIIFSNNFLHAHSDAGAKFLRAYYRAYDYAFLHQGEADGYGGQMYHVSTEDFHKEITTDTELVDAKEAIDAMTASAGGGGQNIFTTLRLISEFARSQGVVIDDIDSLVYPSYIYEYQQNVKK